ncbi:MAG: GNAT family N-acetyltransferase [Massilia sp.]|nr:GNAT family N-acetyltransferase [Massilia sp.]
MTEWQWRSFAELSNDAVYEVLAQRQRVFVLEQACLYNDFDGLDQGAHHLLGWRVIDGQRQLAAYLRCLAPGAKYTEMSLGRVLTTSAARGTGVGRELLAQGIRHAELLHPGHAIKIGAQQYLEAFYASFGFVTISAPYQEDDITHVDMLRPPQARARARALAALDILTYRAEFAADFKRLNLEWLERHFYVEAIDALVLSDPETHILAPGGAIFLARQDGKIVGTCALIRADADRFELSKMAVTSACQGRGIGRRLLERALLAFGASGARRLFLESSSTLTTALTLYESAGFKHVPRPPSAAHYQRADVYMAWQP